MKYTYPILIFVACAVVTAVPVISFAQTIDFEDGTDGQIVVSPIPQVVFSPTGGSNWIYGDWRALNPDNGEPKYNGPYPDGAFYSEGNFFANLGPSQNTGRITLSFEFSTTFTLGYSSAGPIILEAYNSMANLIDSDSGNVNTDTGQLDFLSVEGEIAYLKVGFLGNHWIIDNILFDEIIPCYSDDECDDGLFCNGKEICNANNRCEDGAAPACDDGEFCNGSETCDEQSESCLDGEAPICDDGLYCNGLETCNERLNSCVDGTRSPCDDGDYCNGHEICDELTKSCEDGEDPECADDGIYCNGPEICSTSAGSCISAGNPCREDEFCDEEKGRCMAPDLPEPDPGWPQGQITGGCCGCE